jgi:ceramide glucosyltransferase
VNFLDDEKEDENDTRDLPMILNIIFATAALLSFLLTLWQWLVARRFPLHNRVKDDSFPPAVTLLKPVKGCDEFTESCLRSWFEQDYTGRVQILFGVASPDDPVCATINKLIAQFQGRDAELVVCGEPLGANAKISKLVELERLAKHEILVISDADVRVPPDLLSNIVAPLRECSSPDQVGKEASGEGCGLVTCFYRLANPTTLPMQWEAIAINADFWSQVLQAQSLKPINFALGAVMATRRAQLQEIGGFAALVDCLADDYQLGNRIARRGHGIAILPVVVECWSAPMSWGTVWKHQLRWARTIRVCQPLPYFFSILSNATLWPLVWVFANPTKFVLIVSCLFWLVRIVAALKLEQRLVPPANPDRARHLIYAWLIPLKDLLQTALWLLAFLGNRIEWRGQRMRLRSDGSLEKI